MAIYHLEFAASEGRLYSKKARRIRRWKLAQARLNQTGQYNKEPVEDTWKEKLSVFFIVLIGSTMLYIGYISNYRTACNWTIYIPYVVTMILCFWVIPIYSGSSEDHRVNNEVRPRVYIAEGSFPLLRNRSQWDIAEETEGSADVYIDDWQGVKEEAGCDSPISTAPIEEFTKRALEIENVGSGAKRLIPSFGKWSVFTYFMSIISYIQCQLIDVPVQVGPKQWLPDIPEDKTTEYMILLGLVSFILFLLVVACCVVKSFVC